ncbi:MAG: hypothetical protein PHW96_04380 [Candidatus Nanoarchaeia archaeon]|nr:hypothetical protein [Candidatus Nanoarchaeia archaeon]
MADDDFTPYGAYEKYTPKLNLNKDEAERKPSEKKQELKKKEINKKYLIITILVVVATISIMSLFISMPPTAESSYTETKKWVIEYASCNPYEVNAVIRSFSDEEIKQGVWKILIGNRESGVIVSEAVVKSRTQTLIFNFEQTIIYGAVSFKIISPENEYSEGVCSV